MKKIIFIFFLFIAQLCVVFLNASTEQDGSKQVTASELEDFKNELRRDMAILLANDTRNSFRTRDVGEESSELRGALDDVVTLKVIKMLDDINKDKDGGVFSNTLHFMWNHKYEIIILTIIVGILLSQFDFAGPVLESSSRGFARGSVHLGKNLFVGTAKGVYAGFEDIFNKLFG